MCGQTLSLTAAIALTVWLCSLADNGPEVNTPGHTYGLVGRKRSLTEGGIRMPTLLEWPAMIKANHNSTYPGVSNDLFPTVLCGRSLSVSCCLLLCCFFRLKLSHKPAARAAPNATAAGVASIFEGKTA